VLKLPALAAAFLALALVPGCGGEDERGVGARSQDAATLHPSPVGGARGPMRAAPVETVGAGTQAGSTPAAAVDEAALGLPEAGAAPAAPAAPVPLAATAAAASEGAAAGGAGGGLSGVVHSRNVGSATVRFWLARAERTGRTRVEYAFAVSVQNGGGTILQGAVLVSSNAVATRVVHSCAPFGVTPPGLTRAADAPFVLEQERGVAFDPTRLSLALTATPDPLLCEDPGRVTLRRLNRSEYDHTVRDLLGTSQRPAEDFPADDFGYGFDTIGDVLALSPLLFEKLERAAQSLVEEALRVYPAAPLVDRYEAEDGDVECGGGPYGGFWNLYSECGITHEVPVDLPGTYDVRVRAYESHAGSEYARLQIRVDGAALGGELDVSAPSGAPGVYTRRTSLGAGLHALRVEFTNDFYQPPADRNLWVDWIELVGPVDPPPPAPQIQALRALCNPDAGWRPCHRTMIAAFLRRAWRRPPAPAEVEALARLTDAAAAAGAGFDGSLAVALQAALVSPHFLYRVEIDPHPRSAEVHALSDHELASRLSYFLWASMPDDALFLLADQGQLQDPAVIAAQVRRMIQDPRAQGFVESFTGQWLASRALEDVNPDYALFPSWDDELKEAMRLETQLFFAELLRSPRSFLDLFDADFTYVNDRLAAHYGLPAPGSAIPVRVALSPGGQRGGIFTHGSLLTVTSQPRRTSPVKRGKWALDQLLCIDIPPPPAGVEGMLDQPGGPTGTLRERLAQHRADPQCAACHDYLDPIGLGLEHYDAIGAWRTQDAGQPVDATGQFPDGRSFDGAREMAAHVKADPGTPRCIAERVLIYALGRGLEEGDESHLDGIAQEFAAGGHTLESLLVAIASSEPFRMRRGEPGEGEP
jgi:hypothetical protein